MKLTQSGMSEVTAAMRDSMRSQKNFPPGPVRASDAVSVHPSESLESTMGARMGGGSDLLPCLCFFFFILFMFFLGGDRLARWVKLLTQKREKVCQTELPGVGSR